MSATVSRLVLSESYRYESYRRVHGTLPADVIGIRDAMSKLRAALSRDAIRATGVKADTRARIPIPDYEWRDLEFTVVRGRDVVRFRDGGIDVVRGYDNLAFRSQCIMAIWPARRMDDLETHSGAPGRPTPKHLVRAEYEARWRRGEVLKSVVAEAEALSKWLAKEHPNKLQLTPKTIRNNISADHRKLWQGARK